MSALLEVDNLNVSMRNGSGRLVPVIENLSFAVAPAQTLALVGESGCGKSMTALALMRLLPEDFVITSGRIVLEGRDVLTLPAKQMRSLRGSAMSMIFQEPMTALNPLFTVGDQIGEVLRWHQGLDRAAARSRAIALLRAVQIPAAEQRIDAYPHQLSGGMRQRVMIAMALAGRPKLLIADEPTTALDVTVQAQIFDLLAELQRSTGTAILLITHDLGAVAELADEMLVLYAGRCIEAGASEAIVTAPRHPYTRGLLNCVPHLAVGGPPQPWVDLGEIPGMVPPLGARGADCAFLARCAQACDVCRAKPQPTLEPIAPGHAVSCWRKTELAA
ncbi:ABC transporter ATP-binding protein [Bradyrhizobium sp. SSBR45G]|uniref:ABC transporter ATP-binding protein n=1 Tax=unclassified Bradyrhizobium TaxID=2631580 RepID=UPI0023429AA2|nr:MULTISPECIES: ABC transporter ATP-binding protein [unclassified Bradyrhizobium]GLH76589.1 ABC transporter ATP-binding protein [Bradyrhizobium sp. SSBR45G]GLH84206.1 ABC transporter ATP-binding protein [Bradyrhizobium sp. SSBR45R]